MTDNPKLYIAVRYASGEPSLHLPNQMIDVEISHVPTIVLRECLERIELELSDRRRIRMIVKEKEE